MDLLSDGNMFTFGEENRPKVEYSFPLATDVSSLLLFGYPRRTDNNWSIVINFPASVWLCIAASAFSVALALIASLKVYQRLGNGAVGGSYGAHDVCLQVLATLTEPQGVTMFIGWSSGKGNSY